MQEIYAWLPLVGIAMMRPLGAMIFIPVFSSAMLGNNVIRNALVLMATLPVFPLLTGIHLQSVAADPVAYIIILVSEFCAGLLLGFSAAIPFWAIDMAGFIIDTMRGASMAGIFNPLFSGESSPLGTLFSQLVCVLFMVSGGFHTLLTNYFDSYQLLPPAQAWHWEATFIPVLKQLWMQLYNLSLSFAMPAMVMMVLIDLALGFINRSVQQLNVFMLSMPIKSIIALFMLIIGLPFGLYAIANNFTTFEGGLINHLVTAK